MLNALFFWYNLSMNRWYVLTGGPCSGKTMLLSALSERGFHVEEEVARTYIDEMLREGKMLEEIRKDENAFQDAVCELKIELEDRLSEDELVFFDRALPDTLAYTRVYNFSLKEEYQKRISEAEYRKVFFLESMPFEADYARSEDEETAERIHEELLRVYREIGVEIEFIPIFDTKEERIEYFFKHLRGQEGIEV